ncbi:hypothetical protein BACCIP111883_02953 [Sutcliffiella rhizosphaerae]|uniref:ABC transporter domain-containing protein n=1 Tax=Sutcliffiella rhizosphaerae TaxID=2880967 RepID=A0ABN8AF65_9BACI|nr:hypothetical protein BACCIP111883_02953 [Sutcliffiella rhizosphaerae]
MWKSTILRMIAGLETITRGDLFIGDKMANGLTPSERDLSMVFQNYALYPHLSVKENIVFELHVKKVPKKERELRCLEAAEMLQLIDYLHRKPRELSGGTCQRVTLARGPESIKLVDETTPVMQRLDIEVRNVEILANDSLIAFQVGNKEWFMRLNGQWYIDIGDMIPITFNVEHIALFEEKPSALVKAPIARELFSQGNPDWRAFWIFYVNVWVFF